MLKSLWGSLLGFAIMLVVAGGESMIQQTIFIIGLDLIVLSIINIGWELFKKGKKVIGIIIMAFFGVDFAIYNLAAIAGTIARLLL